MHERSHFVSRLLLLLTAILFSTGGAAIKATTLTSWQVASFRAAVAGTALLLLVPASRRNWSWRTPLVGLAYASTMVLFVSANKLTTSANSIFLQDTAPLYLLLLGPLLLREPIRKSDLLLMAVLAAGLALFFVGEQSPLETAPDPFRGNVMAVVSGLTWAFTVAGLRWLEGKGGGMAAVVAGNAIAALGCLPMALPVVSSQPVDWAVVIYLGIFQIGLAYAMMTRAMRHTPALEASLLLLAEPALNPVWTWFVHGERPHTLAITGGCLIIGATVGAMFRPKASAQIDAAQPQVEIDRTAAGHPE
jgi:drug/metabolite transporter (DMT)-like permease